MLRVLILLLVLLTVALTTWQDRYRSTRWREPLYVAIYPIAADDSAVTSQYLAALDAAPPRMRSGNCDRIAWRTVSSCAA